MLLAIADFSDDDGKAYPAVATLARKCRMTDRNARLVLSQLRGSGELVVRQGAGPKGCNLYRLPMKPATALKNSSALKPATALKPASDTPEEGFRLPLKPASAKPSVNHQEPPEGASRSPKGSRLPSDWVLPAAYSQWSINTLGWPPDRCKRVSEVFFDYWQAVPGVRGVKADWLATWRYWCRREKEHTQAPSSKKHFSETDYSKGLNNDGSF